MDKDGLAIFIIQSKEFAEKDRPEIRLHTTNIEEVYDKVKLTHSELLHPNLNKVTLRPWGAKEFALRDKSNVCVIIQQWLQNKSPGNCRKHPLHCRINTLHTSCK